MPKQELESSTRAKTVARNDEIGICNKYQSLIANIKDPVKALQYFMGLECVSQSSEIRKAGLSHLIDNVAPAVLNRITSLKHLWTDNDRTLLNRFIIILVELESELSSSNDRTLTFLSAQAAINFFSTLTTDMRKTAYPEYLISTLKVLMSYRNKNADSVGELTQKFRSLTKNKNRKDIAIMMSQIIRAGKLLISKGTTPFNHQMVILLDDLYETVRHKNLIACEYILHKTHDSICCDNLSKHAGLQIMETIREIFVEAMKRSNINETIVSVMSNFATVEAKNLSHLDCKNCETLKMNLWQTLRFVTDNVGKIVTACGLNRAKRTLLKFLAVPSLQASDCVHIIDGLLKVCKDADNQIEKISWMAMKFLFYSEDDRRIHIMYDVHRLQKQLDDPKQFKPISSIIEGLPKNDNSLHLDSVQLQLLQIVVEIDYPQLPAMCIQKLVDDLCKMDFYKSDHSYFANLCKSGACYLQCLVHTQSNVKQNKAFEPLNEKDVEITGKLEEALGYLAEFLRDKDVWMGKMDSAGCIPFAEKLLKRIGETLMNRHCRDLAVTAFGLLYEMAKLINHPLNQMIAAGYLIENIHLASRISENEIVAELKSSVLQKLKDITTMSADVLGIVFFGFLQLTMYTTRQQLNISSIKQAKKYKAINKFFNKYDTKNAIYLAARQKYADVMYGIIVKGPGAFQTVPVTGYTSSLPNSALHFASTRNDCLFVFGKTNILQSSEIGLINENHLKGHRKQLNVPFIIVQIPTVTTKTEGGKCIKNEASDVCQDYAQPQDKCVRLLFKATADELQIDEQVRPYAYEVRPKAVLIVQPVQPKNKINSKPGLPSTANVERKIYPKRTVRLTHKANIKSHLPDATANVERKARTER